MFDKAFQNSSVNESYTKSSPELRMVLKPFWTEEAAEIWYSNLGKHKQKLAVPALIHFIYNRPVGQLVNMERLEKALKPLNSIIPTVNAA